MRENIGNAELRLARSFADFNVNKGSVVFTNSAVERKRNCNPLILFNSAVVMSFEIAEPLLLVYTALNQGGENQCVLLKFLRRP